MNVQFKVIEIKYLNLFFIKLGSNSYIKYYYYYDKLNFNEVKDSEYFETYNKEYQTLILNKEFDIDKLIEFVTPRTKNTRLPNHNLNVTALNQLLMIKNLKFINDED